MTKSQELAQLMGMLVQKHRTDDMAQAELAVRIGVGRGSISKLEGGQAVVSATLFEALETLDCIDPIIEVVSDMLEAVQDNPQRKRRIAPKEMSNDF